MLKFVRMGPVKLPSKSEGGQMIGCDDYEVGRVSITATEVGNMVVFRPAMSEFKKAAEMARLPDLLGKSLTAWVKSHPRHKVLHALSIVEDGYTMAIHIWVEPS